MDVLLIVEAVGLSDKDVFNEHLSKEGFLEIEGEENAYEGKATSHLFNTRAYILEVVSKGLKKSGFDECKIIFQVGENPMEAFKFSKKSNDFLSVEV